MGVAVAEELGALQDVGAGVVLHHAGQAAEVGDPHGLLDGDGPPEVVYVVHADLERVRWAVVGVQEHEAALHVVAVGVDGVVLAVDRPQVVEPFIGLCHGETNCVAVHGRVSTDDGLRTAEAGGRGGCRIAGRAGSGNEQGNVR